MAQPSVLLPGTDVRVSRIGFGCASLMARTPRAESIRLLDLAFDAGMTHLDVARAYGYGEAESAVGDFLARRRRDEVTVTTKFGIAPPARSRRLDLAKGIARRLAGSSPRLRLAMRERASRMVEPGRFGVEQARASLETSLRELRTDHVDLLLAHECRPDDLGDDLLALLEDRVRAGHVRAFGIATDPASAARIVRERPEFAAVVQVPDSVLAPPAALGDGPARITHSGLGEGLANLRRHLASPDRAQRWSQGIGEDVTDPTVLAQLMLRGALARVPAGCVLVSSRDDEHIRADAAAAERPSAPHALVAFLALLADDPPAR